MRLLFAVSPPASGPELDDAALVEVYRHRSAAGRPWLRTNFVSSLDGSIQGPDGRSGTINTPSDHQIFALHRAHSDVILVGAQTVRSEGYRAVDLNAGQRALRGAEGLAPYPVLAVISGSLDLDPAVATADAPHGPVMIITGDRPDDGAIRRFEAAGAEVVRLPGDRVQPADVVALLAARDLPRILCEGGPRLHRDLLAAGLVDELSITLSPVAVGGEGQRSTSGPSLPDLARFRLERALHADDQTVFLSYTRA